MKYGVIVFKDTENIGDDIQSYAASKLLPKVDYYIEREKMNFFVPQELKKVKVIMNGWYLHSPFAFPPSSYIDPIITSIHLTDYFQKEIPAYLDDEGIKFLKRKMPIGCRDKHTMELLDKINIDNYFSGCMTLTINPFKNIKKNNSICFVDVNHEIIDHISDLSNNKFLLITKTHYLNKDENRKISYTDRMNNVEKLLKEYQQADLIITSRLHCALPAVALGLNVVLIYDKNSEDIKNRLGDYIDLVLTLSETEFLKINSLDYLFDKCFINSNMKEKIRSGIIKTVNDNLSKSNKTDVISSLNSLIKKQSNRISCIYLNEMFKKDYLIRESVFASEYYNKEIKKKDEEIMTLKQEIAKFKRNNQQLEREINKIKITSDNLKQNNNGEEGDSYNE